MSEDFANLGTEMKTQTHGAQNTPKRMNQKKTTPRHVMIKLSSVEDKENVESGERKASPPVPGTPRATLKLLGRRLLTEGERDDCAKRHGRRGCQ